MLPESIPWLVANGKIKEAKVILLEAAKFNRILLPDDVFDEQCKRPGQLGKHSDCGIEHKALLNGSDEPKELSNMETCKNQEIKTKDSSDENISSDNIDCSEHLTDGMLRHGSNEKANQVIATPGRWHSACSKLCYQVCTKKGNAVSSADDSAQYTFLDIFKSPTLLRNTFFMSAAWYV